MYFKVAEEVKENNRLIKGYSKQMEDDKLDALEFNRKIQKIDLPKNRQLHQLINAVKQYETALKEMTGEEQLKLEQIIGDMKQEAVELANAS